MSTFQQREKLEDLIMGNGLGAVAWRPTKSGQAWGSRGPLGNANGNGNDKAAAEAQRKFLEWMRNAYGDELAELIAIRAEEIARKEAPRDDGLGQTEDGDDRKWWEKIVDAGTEVLPKYLEYQQQADIIDVQMERAREGKPPLNTDEYAPSVQVGLDEKTVERIANEAQSRASAAGGALMQNPLTWIVGGTAAFLIFRSMR